MDHRRFEGGVSSPSSFAFLFVPNPNATLARSPALPFTGVPVLDRSDGSTTCEKLDFIIVLGPGESRADPGPGLSPNSGMVGITPVKSPAAPPFPFVTSFFFLFFSVFPLDSVGGSRNSDACGTDLRWDSTF